MPIYLSNEKINFLFLALSLSFISSTAIAQTVWSPPGATWYYKFEGFISGYEKIQYTHDTVVGGQACKTLKVTHYIWGGGNSYTEDSHSDIFTYQNGDTVFYYSGTQFSILFNIGATAGQSWNLEDWPGPECDTVTVEVGTPGTMMINGQTLRTVDISTTPYWSMEFNGSIIERIGHVDGYMLPLGDECDSTLIVDWPVYSLICYSDDSFQTYMVQQENCGGHVGISDPPMDNVVKIYPNPAENMLNIRASDIIAGGEIQSVTGQLIKTIPPFKENNQRLDISFLTPGIYFIQLNDFKGGISRKIFMKE